MKVTDLGPLETARKARGWTQSELAERSGVLQGNISEYELGTKTLGMGAAKRLAKALDGNAALLVIHSRKSQLNATMKRSDPVAAIQACKSIVEASQELPLQEQDEKALSVLVGQVLDFAGKVETYRDP